LFRKFSVSIPQILFLIDGIADRPGGNGNPFFDNLSRLQPARDLMYFMNVMNVMNMWKSEMFML